MTTTTTSYTIRITWPEANTRPVKISVTDYDAAIQYINDYVARGRGVRIPDTQAFELESNYKTKYIVAFDILMETETITRSSKEVAF